MSKCFNEQLNRIIEENPFKESRLSDYTFRSFLSRDDDSSITSSRPPKTIRCVIDKNFEEIYKKVEKRESSNSIRDSLPEKDTEEDAIDSDCYAAGSARIENHLKWLKEKEEQYRRKKEKDKMAADRLKEDEITLQSVKKIKEREKEKRFREWQEKKIREKEEKKREEILYEVLKEEMREVTKNIDKNKLLEEWVRVKDKQRQLEHEKKQEDIRKQEETKALRQTLAEISYRQWKEKIRNKKLALPKNGYQIFGPKPTPVVKEEWNNDFTSLADKSTVEINPRASKSVTSDILSTRRSKSWTDDLKRDIHIFNEVKNRNPDKLQLKLCKSGVEVLRPNDNSMNRLRKEVSLRDVQSSINDWRNSQLYHRHAYHFEDYEEEEIPQTFIPKVIITPKVKASNSNMDASKMKRTSSSSDLNVPKPAPAPVPVPPPVTVSANPSKVPTKVANSKLVKGLQKDMAILPNKKALPSVNRNAEASSKFAKKPNEKQVRQLPFKPPKNEKQVGDERPKTSSQASTVPKRPSTQRDPKRPSDVGLKEKNIRRSRSHEKPAKRQNSKTRGSSVTNLGKDAKEETQKQSVANTNSSSKTKITRTPKKKLQKGHKSNRRKSKHGPNSDEDEEALKKIKQDSKMKMEGEGKNKKGTGKLSDSSTASDSPYGGKNKKAKSLLARTMKKKTFDKINGFSYLDSTAVDNIVAIRASNTEIDKALVSSFPNEKSNQLVKTIVMNLEMGKKTKMDRTVGLLK